MSEKIEFCRSSSYGFQLIFSSQTFFVIIFSIPYCQFMYVPHLHVCVFARNARKMRLENIVVCSGNGHNIPPWHVHLFGHRKRSTVVVVVIYIARKDMRFRCSRLVDLEMHSYLAFIQFYCRFK